MLSKVEAAKHLGVSLKTLERYTSQGKITAQYEKGHSRPTPVYDEAQLLELKAQLEQARTPSNVKTTDDHATVPQDDKATEFESAGEAFTLRLPLHYARRLEAEAGKHGLDPEAYARSLLIDALESGDQIRLRDDIGDVSRRVDLLGRDLASAVLSLLMFAGKVESEAEARAWVQANMKGCLHNS